MLSRGLNPLEKGEAVTAIVSVRVLGDARKVRQVALDHPELRQRLDEAYKRHGEIRHWRLVGDGEYMDFHEWESVDGRAAFVEEMRPDLVRLLELSEGEQVEAKVWRLPEPDEDF
jgi:hypothetical protein